MTTISLSYTQEDTDWAEHIRQDLEAKSHAIWCKPTPLTMESILYPGNPERTSIWN